VPVYKANINFILNLCYNIIRFHLDGYAYFAHPQNYYRATGKIMSPIIQSHPSSKKCFTFYYQLNGQEFPFNTLSVYIQYNNPNGKKDYHNYFLVSGHQGNFWQKKSLTINKMTSNYQVWHYNRSGKFESHYFLFVRNLLRYAKCL